MVVKKKIFLPKWQRYYVVPLLLIIWLFVTYLEFFGPENQDKLGLVGYLFFSAIFLISGLMTCLMTSGKLPAYIIEETVDKN
ncbi:MAG: hypothetical protein IT416_02760 [Candidatus Pacebacteria bacterium]|nr:hypothetical protein [Candidatus Paceibacterota bacterium]